MKTRLAPLLGDEGAARLHARMVVKTLRTALASGFDKLDVHCSPGVKDVFFRKIRKRFAVGLRSQGRGNLGERMYR
ncbi:MAG: hypothetical protein ACRD3R_05270, partial [Terriglobales bacterium]